MKAIWLAIVITSIGNAIAAAAAPQHDPRIALAISRHIAAHDITGAIIAVDHAGIRTIDVAGTSSDDDRAPLRADTVIWVASLTKPVVATALMMMVEAGRVGLQDPVSKYIPEFARPPIVRTPQTPLPPFTIGHPYAGPPTVYTHAPAHRALIVRDFVTMTAGLQTIGVPNDAIPKITPDDTLATWVPKLAAASLDFEPGSRWSYSNMTQYEVVARIVEVASGQPFARFVQTRILDPLEMHDTNFGPRTDLAGRTAPLGPMMAANPIMMGRFASGSAGLLTTASDYANFAVMLRDGGVFHGRRLLRASTVRAMASNQIGTLGMAGIDPGGYGGLQNRVVPGIKYGFGVAVLTDAPAAGLKLPTGSFGWDGVGSRRMWVIPSLRTVIVMLVPSGEPANAARLHRDVEAIVTSDRVR